jgi:four helix bundle protein
MDNKEFSKQLERRTKEFAIQIIKLSSSFPTTTESKVIRNQITKSGTSIGANYREANRARSSADFINKIRICEGEASETMYWLEIAEELEWIAGKIKESITKEADELLSIFTSIGRKMKMKKD